MQISALEVEAEHQAALGSLTLAQRRAFERIALAESRSWRDGGGIEHHLEQLFAYEASGRSMRVANDR